MSSSYIFSDIFDSLTSKVPEFLLSDNGKQMLSVIYTIAEQKILLEPKKSAIKYNYSEKADETKKRLEDIIDRFEKADEACSDFLNSYPIWADSRKTTIEELNAIADALHADRLKGNISKIVGGSVGALGGAAVIGSFIFPPLLLPLSVGGGIASILGGGAVFGTSVTEIVLLKKRMELAKTILENDQDRFLPLRRWFQRSHELMEAIEEVVGFQLMQNIQEEIRVFLNEYKLVKFRVDEFCSGKSLDQLQKLLNVLVGKLISCGSLLMTVGPKLAPVVVSFIVVMFIMPMRNSCLLDKISLIQRLTIGMLSGVDAGMEFGRVAAAVAMRGALKGAPAVAENIPKVLARSVRLGLFIGVGIALDVTNIILTSIDLHKGSLSDHGKELKKAAEELKIEFVFVEQVHDELKKTIF